MVKRTESRISDQVLDELLKGVSKPEDLLGADGLFKGRSPAISISYRS